MERRIGTISRGLRAPIIKEGDDLKKIVVDTLMSCIDNGDFEIGKKDVLAVTESILARSQANYATTEQLAEDVKNKLGGETVGVVFPILSRNRFAICLRGIAKGAKKVVLMLSYPSDEVGNALVSQDQLDEAGVNPYSDVLSLEKYRELFGENRHPFTGVDYVAYYKELFEAEGCESGAALFAALKKAPAELVILDVMLPGEDGLEILKKLRLNAATRSVPVIMATARGEEYDKINGLDSGADDYLVKPFGMMEMVSRVRAVLRRSNPERTERAMEFHGITIDPASHRVTANGREVMLTLKEYELLHALMASPGVVFTRDRLLSEIWGTDYDGETRTVDVHIRTLRQKLGDAGAAIGTVRGVGYRMEA